MRTHAISVQSCARRVRTSASSVRSSASVVRSSASSFDDFGVPSWAPVMALLACGGAGGRLAAARFRGQRRTTTGRTEKLRDGGRKLPGRLRRRPAQSSTASRLRRRRPARVSLLARRSCVGLAASCPLPGSFTGSCGPSRPAWAARTQEGTAVELVGDAGERRPRSCPNRISDEAPTGVLGDVGKTGIRPIGRPASPEGLPGRADHSGPVRRAVSSGRSRTPSRPRRGRGR